MFEHSFVCIVDSRPARLHSEILSGKKFVLGLHFVFYCLVNVVSPCNRKEDNYEFS